MQLAAYRATTPAQRVRIAVDLSDEVRLLAAAGAELREAADRNGRGSALGGVTSSP